MPSSAAELHKSMMVNYRLGLNARLSDKDRLRSVYGTLLDADLRERLVPICRTAAATLRAPGSDVTLLTSEGQQTLASWREQPRRGRKVPASGTVAGPEDSMCVHTLMLDFGDALNIEDTFEDLRVCHSTFTTEGDVRAYLGVPLLDLDAEHTIGSLCVVDSKPREWSSTDVFMLSSLAMEAAALLNGGA